MNFLFGKSKSIFWRLMLSYLFIVLVGLGAVGIFVSYTVKGYIYQSKQDDLVRKAQQLNLVIQKSDKISASQLSTIEFLGQSYGTTIWVFDKSGKIIATSAKKEVYVGKSVSSSIVKRVLQGQNVTTKLHFAGLKVPMLSVVVPWGKSNNVYGGIVLHSPILGMQITINHIRESVLWALLIGMILSAVMVSYFSWSISRPLKRIDQVALKIGAGEYDERIPIRSNDELAELSETINYLADKLEKSDTDRSRIELVRQDFLGNVSHELRTPLTALQGFLEALQDGLIDDLTREKYYDIMYRETTHMNHILDDIMNMTKLDNQEVILTLHPVDAGELADRAAFKFKQEAAAQQLELIAEVENELPPVKADEDRLEQVLDNIIKNAVKFTETGTIKVSAYHENPFVVFSVEDSGMGMASHDVEHIFERFYKADRGRSRKNKGSGLGLSIAKQIVDLHGGRITVYSELGEGSRFELRIPAAAQALPAESADDAAQPL